MTILRKIWRRARSIVSPTNLPSDQPAIIHSVEQFWCDRHGFYAKGWLIHGTMKLENISIVVGVTEFGVSRHDRPDVLIHYPDADPHCGFEAYVECLPFVPAFFRVRTATGIEDIPIVPRKKELVKRGPTSLYTDFLDRVNQGGLSVLEIGSRIVGPMSIDNRIYFPNASKYVGFDVHAAPGVDVSGDVHNLSSLVGEESIDAIYSISVLEHLQVPWLAAAEMSKTLKPGGLIFHSTLHSWPLHETPNDFWRFSDEGLKVLFGPMFGFEVIAATLDCPMTIIPDYRDGALLHVALGSGYAEACVMARKTESSDCVPKLHDRAKLYPIG